MNLKMIAEICNELDKGSKIKCYDSCNSFRHYQKIDDIIYKINEFYDNKTIVKGIDFNTIYKFEVVTDEPKYKIGDWVYTKCNNPKVNKIERIQENKIVHFVNKNWCHYHEILRHSTLEDLQNAVREMFEKTGKIICYNIIYWLHTKNHIAYYVNNIIELSELTHDLCISILNNAKPYEPEKEKVEFDKILFSYDNAVILYKLFSNQQKLIKLLQDKKII